MLKSLLPIRILLISLRHIAEIKTIIRYICFNSSEECNREPDKLTNYEHLFMNSRKEVTIREDLVKSILKRIKARNIVYYMQHYFSNTLVRN